MRLWVNCVIVCLLAYGLSAEGNAQPSKMAARQIVLDQLALELGAVALRDPRSTGADVRFDSLLAPTRDVTIWRAYVVGQSEPFQYLLALVKGSSTPLRLGGFQTCRIEDFSLLMGRPISSVRDAIELVRMFVLAADPNGARDLIIPADDSSGTGFLEQARGLLPQFWPRDTAVVLMSGDYYVRRTVFSHVVSSGYGHPWQAIGYSFMIDGHGRIVSWRVREGPFTEVLSAPGARRPSEPLP